MVPSEAVRLTPGCVEVEGGHVFIRYIGGRRHVAWFGLALEAARAHANLCRSYLMHNYVLANEVDVEAMIRHMREAS